MNVLGEPRPGVGTRPQVEPKACQGPPFTTPDNTPRDESAKGELGGMKATVEDTPESEPARRPILAFLSVCPLRSPLESPVNMVGHGDRVVFDSEGRVRLRGTESSREKRGPSHWTLAPGRTCGLRIGCGTCPSEEAGASGVRRQWDGCSKPRQGGHSVQGDCHL